MIRKLKRRFILVIMSFLLTVELVIFAVLAVMMDTSSRRALEDTLRFIVQTDGRAISGVGFNLGGSSTDPGAFPDGVGGAVPDTAPETGNQSNTPLRDPGGQSHGGATRFTDLRSAAAVLFDTDGNVTKVITAAGDSETVTGTDALSALWKSGKTAGTVTLGSVSYRYLLQNRGESKILALVSRDSEIRTLRQLVTNSLLIGSGSLLLFYGAAVLLSGWAIRPITEAWEKQRRFVADASHELKTPLTVIAANLDVVTSSPDSTVSQQMKWLGNIRSEDERMQRLVFGLLTLARIDAEESTAGSRKDSAAGTKKKPFSISRAVTEVCLPFEPVIFELGKQFEMDIEPDVTFTGDEDAIRQLAVILLDNALKNTFAHGYVRLSLKKDEKTILLTCRNTGHGIPPEETEKIFERFYRPDNSRSRETGGSGLGLSIARGIVTAHGGKISCESVPDRETVFTVRLPV